MANLNLTGQTAKADQLRPYLVAWKVELDKRRDVWNRLSPEKRRAWVQAAETKDPLFDLFVQLYKYTQTWDVPDDA